MITLKTLFFSKISQFGLFIHEKELDTSNNSRKYKTTENEWRNEKFPAFFYFCSKWPLEGFLVRARGEALQTEHSQLVKLLFILI